jgi:hypothetical protein
LLTTRGGAVDRMLGEGVCFLAAVAVIGMRQSGATLPRSLGASHEREGGRHMENTVWMQLSARVSCDRRRRPILRLLRLR